MIRCVNCFEQYDGGDQCPNCGYVKGSPPQEIYHLFPGTLLANRYIIGMVLGFGGFGITYKAWDNKLETVVAIKEFYLTGVVNRIPGTKEVKIYAKKRKNEFYNGKDRFLDEARNMAKFNSEPNIVNVYEFFEENNTAYIVMEFLDGISLSQHLEFCEGILDVESGLQVTEAIANALIKIHSKGIIHRDISPDNIFLCGNNTIKLIDFGAARFSNEENKLMSIILKPGFAPPEQYEQINKQGPWTDIYALGATLYYIITGVKPEESTNRKINDTLPYPHEVNKEIPEYLSNTIMKAMAIDVHMRFQNAQEFLQGIKQERKVLPVAIEKKRRKTKRIAGVLAAFAVVGAGASIAAINWEKEKAEETLPDSTIKMWYCKSGDAELDEAEASAYQAIIDDFKTSFPNVTIEFEGFDSTEYKAKLQSSDNQPNIYEYVNVESTGEHLSLKDLYNSETIKQCSVLSKAEEYYNSTDYLPLGFNAPVVFVDKILTNSVKNSISSVSDFAASSPEVDNCVIDYEAYKEMFPGSEKYFDQSACSDFCEEKAAFYGTTTNNYMTVAKELPARYKVLYCDTDNVYCSFDNIWTANDIEKDQNKAALRFLEFMLNNNAQDQIHIRNKSTTLPVNDAVIDVFRTVNGEFKDFFINQDKYIFKK